MAIRIRRGNQIDFDPNKLLPGELGLVLDMGKLYFCYSAGNTKQLQTAEDLQNMLNASGTSYTALQQLITDLNTNPNELTNILANISALQSGKLDKTGDSKDNIISFTEAASDTDILSNETHTTIFGKILKSIKTLRTSLTDKFNKTDIIQTTVVNDAAKVPSSAVTYSLAQSIQTLSDNLVKYTMTAITIATQAELDAALNSVSTANSQWYRLVITISASGLTLDVGMWYVEGFRAYSSTEWQKATRAAAPLIQKTRVKSSSTWQAWI